MQAQSYPPEPKSSRSASTVPSAHPQGRRPGLSPSRASSSGRPNATTEALQQAAKTGDFRAIATLLNQYLAPHGISTWVGEAGPGYLQITLTVKRPPQRKPLIRIISYQLYTLRSDVILGANLTVQLAQTNFILWHQVIRLPLPEIYKQPSKWDVWREAVIEAAQSTWTQSQAQAQTWYERARSHPWFVQAVDFVANRDSGAVTDPASSSQPPIQPAPDSNTEHKANNEGVQNTQPWTELAMLPVGFNSFDLDTTGLGTAEFDTGNSVEAAADGTLEPLPDLSPNPRDISETAGAAAKPEATIHGANGSAAEVKAIALNPSTPTNQPPQWQQRARQIQATVVHHVLHPSPFILGGAAVVAFSIGGGIEALHYVFGRDRSPSDSASVSETQSPAKDAASPRVLPPSNTAPSSQQPDSQPETSRAETPSSVSLSRANRPPVVNTAVGEVDVITILPTTSGTTDVTLTFSNSAIVALPPAEPPEPKTWQWPFGLRPPAAPISHPADLATAFLHHPPQDDLASQTDSTSQIGNASQLNRASQANRASLPSMAGVTPQYLQQGGIDLVNIAGNDVASSQRPSLLKTLRMLEQSAIYRVGAGSNATEARRPQIFDIKGHRIAVLGYVDNHLYRASTSMAGTNPGSPRHLLEDIETIRDQVDWVIVTFQWDGDLEPAPTEQQVNLAHFAIDQGADLVVGHHPTVMQGSEVYNGRAIAYSLGPIPTSAPQTLRASSIQETQRSLLKLSTSSETQRTQAAESEGTSSHVLNQLPHQLPASGVRAQSPRSAYATVETASDTEGLMNQPVEFYETAMLKVILGDRHIGIEFIPVQQSPTAAEFIRDSDSSAPLRAIKEASRGLDNPLRPNGMVQLSLEHVESLPNSAGSSFQPSRTDSFIGNDADD